MNEYKLFKVNEEYPEYIVAQTAAEALNDHNKRGGEGFAVTMDEVEEISLDMVGNFEQEDGSRKLMSFYEFIGHDFVYENPTLICWTE
ncbi:hypothetical protein [Brevibacillus laterosporus]|uniref:hypothetical protein n=1 Tax=Brevibacillus laterosporus TaxID=1465 RepID=UPI000E6C899C|nr:hypothetical protein [Brevibacillus laterosporus]AYB37633.1 hypothetical protein D5F52_04670 [Brevibacillus laterosporus]MBM7110878.1 hypothetical protein [Brevibacillus laterosporus]